MKNYSITKQRAGQEEKFFGNIYASSFSDAKKEFKQNMLQDLYEQEDGTILDECGNEVWGFRDNYKTFEEDVNTYRLKTLKESEKWN